MDQAKVEALAAAERKWFRDGRPRSMEATSRATGTMPRGVPMSWMDELYDHPPLWVSHGAGSRFWDLDGHEYVDMYVADMEVATGGTLFANALSMAAARAALTEVLTPEAFITTARLGHQLAAGGPSPRSIAWRSPMMRWAGFHRGGWSRRQEPADLGVSDHREPWVGIASLEGADDQACCLKPRAHDQIISVGNPAAYLLFQSTGSILLAGTAARSAAIPVLITGMLLLDSAIQSGQLVTDPVTAVLSARWRRCRGSARTGRR